MGNPGRIIGTENKSKYSHTGKKLSNKTTIDFLLSSQDASDKNLLGRYNSNCDKIELFLGSIVESCYKEIKKENKDLFSFLESDSNRKSNALDREYFENVIDGQLFDSTKDKITEVLLHELTHKFGNAHHPQDYKAGMKYIVNSYIDRLYNDVHFSEMEKEAKDLLKNCYNIQSYTTNNFNSKIRKVIGYCNDR